MEIKKEKEQSGEWLENVRAFMEQQDDADTGGRVLFLMALDINVGPDKNNAAFYQIDGNRLLPAMLAENLGRCEELRDDVAEALKMYFLRNGAAATADFMKKISEGIEEGRHGKKEDKEITKNKGNYGNTKI